MQVVKRLQTKHALTCLDKKLSRAAAWLAQLVRHQSDVREVSGSIPGRTNTQGLKITEEKVLPLL